MTLALFMVLPLMETIGSPSSRDLLVRPVDVASLPPPPPPPPSEEPEEEEPPPPPPQLREQVQPLELAQLELALNPGIGDGGFGDFTIDLSNQLAMEEGGLDQIFSLADLDQRPRVIFQRMPAYPPDLRKRNRQGTVYIVFTVDTGGRVVAPRVDKSTDPAFDAVALDAVKQWRFEPGTRGGEKVQFRMRVPITFNAG
jgi:protein TonB